MGKRNKFCLVCGELALANYSYCKECRSTKTREAHILRYKEDVEFRNKCKKNTRLSQQKKRIEQPGHYAKQQRDYRINNPDKFNMIMVNTYVKKLNNEQKAILIEMLSKELKQ